MKSMINERVHGHKRQMQKQYVDNKKSRIVIIIF